jgi:NAD(P)-dependent dehydrogenase (short-subunit alcohol dehydrogenase family)
MAGEAPVLVVGGSRGIGRALAALCTARGDEVHVAARDEAALRAVAGELGVVPHAVDARDPDAVADTVEAIAGSRGLAGLAYCPGTIDLRPLPRVTDDAMRAAFELDVLGALRFVQAAAAALRDARGAVVLFSTVAVAQGFPAHAVVGAAKGAVEGLARSLAAELAPRVRVNCVAPSLVRTPLSAPLLGTAAVADGIARLHPLGRLGEPADPAGVAAFLLSDAASWMTGQVIAVDGGRGALRVRA